MGEVIAWAGVQKAHSQFGEFQQPRTPPIWSAGSRINSIRVGHWWSFSWAHKLILDTSLARRKNQLSSRNMQRLGLKGDLCACSAYSPSNAPQAGKPMTLNQWQERLEAHFAQLRDER